MFKRYLMVLAMVLALPAFANAWYVNVKSSSTAQGTISPAGNKYYAAGIDSVEYAVTPTAGYNVSRVTLDGVSIAANGNGKYVAPYLATKSWRYLVAYFATNTVSITTSVTGSGTIREDNFESLTNIPVGSARQLLVIPNPGYTVSGVTAAGAIITDNGDGSKTVVYTNLQANQSVSASFALVPVVTASAGNDVNTTGNEVARAATLVGSATSNQGAVAYAWTGTGLVFGTPAAATTTVYSATPGSYTATLTVTSNGITVTDTALVNVVSSIAYDNSQCTACHNNNTPLTVAAYNAGNHGTPVVSCQGCHNSGHVPAKASVSVPPVSPDVVDAGDSFLPAPVEFAGSNSCLPCHANKFEGWSKSLHNKPTKYIANQGEGILLNDAVGTPAGNDFVEGFNFNDVDFQTKYGYANPFASQAAGGTAPILKKVGSDYIIQIGATEYKINRTQGGNGYWKQRYYTEVGGGNYVLPIQYNEVSKRYSAYNPQYWYAAATSSTPRFSEAYGSAELLAAFKAANAAGGDGPASSSWENRCAGCHQSGLTVRLIDGEVVSGYADLNVGCEACHGPAAAHVAAPAKTNIVNPNDYLSQAGGAYKAAETCGKCHQRGESKVYIGAGATKAAAGTVGSIQKKIEAPAQLSGDLTTALFFPMGGDLFGGNWYTDNVGVFGTKGSMTYNGYTGFPTYVGSNQHHQQWEDMEQGKHGATYAENTPGAQKMACWSCHDLHAPKGSHNTKTKITVGGTTLTNVSADNNTLCLACHAGKGKFAALTLATLQAEPTGADVVAAVNAHVSARIPGKTISVSNYLAAGRKGGGSSTYGLITYKNGQCVSCHMALVPTSTGVRVYTDALGKGQGDQHSHTMKTLLAPAGTSITSCSGCHSDFTDFVAEKLSVKTVEAGQSTAGVPAAAGFTGSNACKSCHLEQFSGYTNTLHNKPLKTVAVMTDSIFVNDSNNNLQNDFLDGLNFNTADATVLQSGSANWNNMIAGGNAPIFSVEAGKYYITIGAVKYEIVRTQGGNGKWKQRYHTKIGNSYYVLPVQYNEISKKYEAYNNGNWYKSDNTPWITQGVSNIDPLTVAQVSDLLLAKNVNGGATGTAAKGPSTANWDNRCASCHQTGVAIEYKSVTGSSPMEVVASSADLNIGCESCHGGGASHIQNPYAADSITNPGKWSNKYRSVEVCGQCHARVEGFAHFSSATGRLYAGIEAPSQIVEGSEETKAKGYVLGDVLLNYIDKVIPKAWKQDGTSAASAPSLPAHEYDGATGKMVNGVAADGHHQQWHDLSSGAHGASAGITCFNCHDPHKSTSGNIRTSVKMGEVTVATKSNDNSLCLSCHAGQGVFAAVTAADVAGIAAQPNSDVVMEAVYSHLVARAGYPVDETKKASWKTKYLQSVQFNGNAATFGIAVYRVGECISCHMPFSAKSGIKTSTNANGRSQGDQRAHTMKTLWPGLTGLGAQGLTTSSPVTSCSACHAVTL